MTRDFTKRTRARIADTRAAIAKLREARKEAIRQVAKIDKQHTADRTRIYDRLRQLADDVVNKLPEEATEADSDRARAIQEQIHDLSSDIDEISLAGSSVEDLAGSSVEDLAGMLGDVTNKIYAHLRKAESQLAKGERLGAKLDI